MLRQLVQLSARELFLEMECRFKIKLFYKLATKVSFIALSLPACGLISIANILFSGVEYSVLCHLITRSIKLIDRIDIKIAWTEISLCTVFRLDKNMMIILIK